jgi:signal transduction histidine kinase
MERIHQIQELLSRLRRTPWMLLGLTLAILAGAILITNQQTRARIRAQIAGRDGEILTAVARIQVPEDPELANDDEYILDPANQLDVLFEISQISDVMGARLFDTNGQFVVGLPGEILEGQLRASDLSTFRTLRPVSRFFPAMSLSEIFLPQFESLGVESPPGPVLEVSVPLHTVDGKRLVGIAQFIIDGQSIQTEFAQLDRHLMQQGLVAFGVGGLILVAAISWAFQRLNRAHRLLAHRTEHLVRANQELALAAKTSAVGAVTSHLIHGLKNPLTGLQNFVGNLASVLADHPDADLQHAIASTRRMQSMINEVVSVLHEEEGSGHYELPVGELVELVIGRVRPLSRERGVILTPTVRAEALLPNRVANLVALILVNVLQNAIEATPRGKEATLSLYSEGEQLVCEVQDQGPGIPSDRKVFVPCQSTKEGGSGIGLAISKQLANHLGASLELRNNSPAGCLFALSLPTSLWKTKTSSVTITLG